MINFFYKYFLISILSFITSNLIFFFLEKVTHPSFASLITIIIVFNLNTLLLFKSRLFLENRKNYFKLLIISILFRIFEFIFFNFLYFLILTNLKSNYIFIITLITSYVIKSIVYYKSSSKQI